MNNPGTVGFSGARSDETLLLPLSDVNRSDGGPGTSALDRLLSTPGTLSRFGPGQTEHEVKPGETLSQIAAANNTTTEKLAAINGISNPDLIRAGQYLRIPNAGYEVKPGDTLSGIARANHTSVAALAARNHIANPDRIHVGQTIYLGTPAPVTARQPAAPAPATVSPGNAPQTGDISQPGAASIKAADIAARRAEGHASIGKCYAWVKTALQQSGAVPDYMPGVAAKGAGPALEQRGFINILDKPGANIRSPYDAPKGAVLVYGAAPGATDKNAKYGHIEIRTATGFASDYASANARTGAEANGLSGRGRVLIGVYVKPDAEAPAKAAPAAPAGTATPASPASDANGAYSEQNLSLGANEGYRDAILEASRRTGMTPQTIAAVINAEASKDRQGVWQANAKAGTSSATGLTQFLKGSWESEATRAGSLLNQEAKAKGFVNENNQVVDRDGLLAARNDPRLSILAGADYARHNLTALRDSGHIAADASPAALAKYAYVAHHEGLRGARGLLSGDMSYLSDKTFRANVPEKQQQAYLDAAGGDTGSAYRNWLSRYVDAQIDVTRFMQDGQGVDVPSLRSLYR